jgi:hypothetical protein
VLALLIAILVAVCLLGGIEWRLREAGFRPNVRDSVELWASQRARASQLGNVQLAIDGSSNLPVLEDLANDPSVTGTILVSTHAGLLIPKARPDRADEWVKSYNESYRGLYSPVIETHLKSSLMAYSALYSSALPFDLFPSVITGEYQKDQYLITERNRERDADHRLVKMPDFYATRVVLHLGGLDGRTGARNLDEFNQLVSSAIKALPQQDNSDYFKQLAYVYSLAGKIQERGGRVGFLRMPTDKWVWITDEKRYPRAMFWDLFAVGSPVPTFHFKDFARLAEHDLPDGSHIDKRDKRQFTRSLAEILNQDLLQERHLKQKQISPEDLPANSNHPPYPAAP